MPEIGAVVWAGIAGLILVMLTIIGYLIKTGFDGIMAELKTIWAKIEAHQVAATENALAIREINARCEERHKQHH